MPEVKGLKPGNISDCVCVFAEKLGPAKQTLITFIQSLIAILQTLKAYLLLTNFSIEDELRKLAYQAELAFLKSIAGEIIAGFNTVLGLSNSFSDCAPIGSLSRIVRRSRDEVVAPIYEEEFEVEQLIAAIDRKKRQASKIQNWIDWLNALMDAIDACGEK
jgi:hypothetical protein